MHVDGTLLEYTVLQYHSWQSSGGCFSSVPDQLHEKLETDLFTVGGSAMQSVRWTVTQKPSVFVKMN